MEAPTIFPSSLEEIKESIKIEQENKKYLLEVKIISEMMTLTLSNIEEFEYFSYARKFTLKEIKEIHQVFMGLNSCKEFLEFLKGLSEIKKLSIKQKENKLNIEFEIEYLLKKKTIEIEIIS